MLGWSDKSGFSGMTVIMVYLLLHYSTLTDLYSLFLEFKYSMTNRTVARQHPVNHTANSRTVFSGPRALPLACRQF